MNSKGSINPNFDAFDALDELLHVVVNELSSESTRLAIWTVEAFNLSQFDYQLIGSESPFLASSSILGRYQNSWVYLQLLHVWYSANNRISEWHSI